MPQLLACVLTPRAQPVTQEGDSAAGEQAYSQQAEARRFGHSHANNGRCGVDDPETVPAARRKTNEFKGDQSQLAGEKMRLAGGVWTRGQGKMLYEES
jgi:hypothetical protein